MNWRERVNAHIFLICASAIFLFLPNIIFSQVLFKGKVVYESDATPAAYATIELMNQKGGGLSDKSGDFSFYISKVKDDDTLLISSVGYESLKIPVSVALTRSEFVLSEKSNKLEAVVVKAFTTRLVVGAIAEASAYFRSWNYKRTGGEIGRIFKIPYKEYKIDKIRFKVNNRCDTCQMRLHIRNVIDGIPGEEIVSDSITVDVKSLTMDDKTPEFDLSPYDLTFRQKEIFVSIEVVNCRNNSTEPCSFCFVGTEKGAYLYKSRSRSDWETSNDYSIYLNLSLRY